MSYYTITGEFVHIPKDIIENMSDTTENQVENQVESQPDIDTLKNTLTQSNNILLQMKQELLNKQKEYNNKYEEFNQKLKIATDEKLQCTSSISQINNQCIETNKKNSDEVIKLNTDLATAKSAIDSQNSQISLLTEHLNLLQKDYDKQNTMYSQLKVINADNEARYTKMKSVSEKLKTDYDNLYTQLLTCKNNVIAKIQQNI